MLQKSGRFAMRIASFFPLFLCISSVFVPFSRAEKVVRTTTWKITGESALSHSHSTTLPKERFHLVLGQISESNHQAYGSGSGGSSSPRASKPTAVSPAPSVSLKTDPPIPGAPTVAVAVPSSTSSATQSPVPSTAARETETIVSSGTSVSPTPIPQILYNGVFICKARNPIWNVGIVNKMGELLILAYPGSLEKANEFAECIRNDATTMKREEYLTFAMYNCVGTEHCTPNLTDGSCQCNARQAPERCINVDYTRALIACKYAT